MCHKVILRYLCFKSVLMRLVIDIFKNTTGFFFFLSEYYSKQVFKLLREGGWKLFGFCISVRAVK